MQGPGGGLGEGGIAAVYPLGQRAHGQGLDPAFLAVQLRKLQKKQKGALRELQAASGREAFWKHSAHSAEQALDEVTPWLSGSLRTICMSKLWQILLLPLAVQTAGLVFIQDQYCSAGPTCGSSPVSDCLQSNSHVLPSMHLVMLSHHTERQGQDGT